MINKERISRHDRRRPFTPAKIFIIAALSLFLLGIVGYKLMQPTSTKPPIVPTSASIPKIDISILGDSIIANCCRSYGLTANIVFESNRSQPVGVGGSLYRHYLQEWPDEIPFVNFAQRLTRMAAVRNLNCECLESEKGNWAECTLKLGRKLASGIRLTAGRKCKLAEREVAFLLDNFGTLKGEEVITLIKSGFTFGYISTPDVYPSAEVRKLMARANITTILTLPPKKADWISLASIMGMAGKSGKKKVSPVFNSNLIDEILARQPDAKIFCFKPSNIIEKDVVSLVVERASRKKMSYLPIGSSNYKLDSLGIPLKVKKLYIQGESEVASAAISDLKLRLFNKLLSADSLSQELIIRPDVSKIGIDNLINLKSTLDRLGVKVRPVSRLLEPIAGL